MKHLTWFICCFLFFISCKKIDRSYVIPETGEPITGEVWKSAEPGSLYDGLQITDSYYFLTNYKHSNNDTILQIYAQNEPSKRLAYLLKGRGAKRLETVEFVKSNTRYPSQKDDIWIIDNKSYLKQIRYSDNSLSVINNKRLHASLKPGIDYNFTKDEIYGVLPRDEKNRLFYFFHADSGYYWVNMNEIPPETYDNIGYASLSNLCVNENKKAIACTFRFYNKIQFFDLRGNMTRDILFGEQLSAPVKNAKKSLNFPETKKCFIDIYGTDQYLYCLYDGSADFNEQSKIVIFKWDGTHVKTLQADRILKKIAVDNSNSYFIALADNTQEGRDVVHYSLNGILK